MTHEVVLTGSTLRRIESAIQTRDLAWIAAYSERYRSQANDKAFISGISARCLEEKAEAEAKITSETDGAE